MSDSDTIYAIRLDDGSIVQEMPDGTTRPLESRTDWEYLAQMTEEEIEANALSDEDNPPITAEQLARMRRVPNSRAIRERLNVTQEQFSDRFELPLDTVRDWELGRRRPNGAAKTLLRVIDADPDAVVRALARAS